MIALARNLIHRDKVDDDRLLRLFWNRAELKREFAKLQRERERIVEQMKQQEGALLRGQQRLEQLEGLLADPERAASAAVFYQLRGIWAWSRRRLSRLAKDLAARQLDRETQRDAARFDEHRRAALAAIEARLAPLREQRAGIDEELTALRARRFECRGCWHYFTRRRLDAELRERNAERLLLEEQIERYERAWAEKEQERSAPPEVLGVDGRRLVNLSVIALAQELLLELREHGVAALAREASLRQVTEINYGAAAACRTLSRQIDAVLKRVEALDELPARVRRRAEYLRTQAIFRRDDDTVPVQDCLTAIPVQLTADGEPRPANARELPVNVLADEYWEIYSVLMN